MPCFPRNLYGPMALKVRQSFPETGIGVHGWLSTVIGGMGRNGGELALNFQVSASARKKRIIPSCRSSGLVLTFLVLWTWGQVASLHVQTPWFSNLWLVQDWLQEGTLKSTLIVGILKSEFLECALRPLSSHSFPTFFPLLPLQALSPLLPLFPSSPFFGECQMPL